ncbi:MAG: hypothetical protein J0I53_08300 [Chryseobacterium sp.]|nr:hypothetical protein [Chryseobacterium sp.]
MQRKSHSSAGRSAGTRNCSGKPDPQEEVERERSERVMTDKGVRQDNYE